MAKVLVVDDVHANRQLISYLINSLGHETRCASGAREGFREAREWKPTLVLIDLHMPEADGIQLARALKASPETAPIPLVLCTLSGTEDEIRDAHEAGFSADVPKAREPQAFIANVEGVLRHLTTPEGRA